MIRLLRPADAQEAAAIAHASMPQPWSAQAFASQAENPQVLLLAEESGETGELRGYISLQLTPDDAELTGIAVLPRMRRSGIGSALLKAAQERLAAQGIYRIVLEVRVSNAAAYAFYEKHGFAVIGVRKGFYEFPKEDARVMIKEFEK